MTNASDVSKGQAIRHHGAVCLVLETQHRTPGNLRAFVQMTLRNLKTGRSSVERFSSSDKVETVTVTRKKCEYSYREGQDYVFMDPDSYETIPVPEELVGKAKDYFTENQVVDLLFTDDTVAAVELPPTVTLKVVRSPEGVRGDSATNVMKVAELETGLSVQVPLFIKEGEKIKISTAEGKYLSRA
ncbi:MAG: elongation factor P [Candidatus Methylacidiphilaceae bacterium]